MDAKALRELMRSLSTNTELQDSTASFLGISKEEMNARLRLYEENRKRNPAKFDEFIFLMTMRIMDEILPGGRRPNNKRLDEHIAKITRRILDNDVRLNAVSNELFKP